MTGTSTSARVEVRGPRWLPGLEARVLYVTSVPVRRAGPVANEAVGRVTNLIGVPITQWWLRARAPTN